MKTCKRLSMAIVGDGKSISCIPDLLCRVLAAEADQVMPRPALSLLLAVHAVMLDTGFLKVDNLSNHSSSTGLLSGWTLDGGMVNLQYTLAELVQSHASTSSAARSVGAILLRCHVLGIAFIAYGTIAGVGGSQVHRLCLPISNFVRPGDQQDRECSPEEARWRKRQKHEWGVASIFTNVRELWKEVKNLLSLPLLTDLCCQAGLPPPPSLLLLPKGLKFKVLECLPAQSLAAVACACSEFKVLSAADDLWKNQFELEFGRVDVVKSAPGGRGWKAAFSREWLRKKKIEQAKRDAERRFRVEAFSALQRPVFPFCERDYGGFSAIPLPTGTGSGTGRLVLSRYGRHSQTLKSCFSGI